MSLSLSSFAVTARSRLTTTSFQRSLDCTTRRYYRSQRTSRSRTSRSSQVRRTRDEGELFFLLPFEMKPRNKLKRIPLVCSVYGRFRKQSKSLSRLSNFSLLDFSATSTTSLSRFLLPNGEEDLPTTFLSPICPSVQSRRSFNKSSRFSRVKFLTNSTRLNLPKTHSSISIFTDLQINRLEGMEPNQESGHRP